MLLKKLHQGAYLFVPITCGEKSLDYSQFINIQDDAEAFYYDFFLYKKLCLLNLFDIVSWFASSFSSFSFLLFFPAMIYLKPDLRTALIFINSCRSVGASTAEARRIRRRSISMTPEIGDDIVRLMLVSLFTVLTLNLYLKLLCCNWFIMSSLLPFPLLILLLFYFSFLFGSIGVNMPICSLNICWLLILDWLRKCVDIYLYSFTFFYL